MTRFGGSCQPEPVIPAERPRLLGFGGVAAVGPGGPVDLGGPKQRAVLALLMLEPGRRRAARPNHRPGVGGRAAGAGRGVGARLHLQPAQALIGRTGWDPSSVIEFRDRGYVLDVPPDSVDLHLFDTLVDDGLARTEPATWSLPARS